MTGRKMAVICRVLGISRACAYRTSAGRPRRYAKATDRVVTAQVRTIIRTRASYGARRVHALVNQRFATGYNVKRIQRVMALHGWTPHKREEGANHCWGRCLLNHTRPLPVAVTRSRSRPSNP
ncbi:MAG: transposase [Gemmatimonadales bacterium]|nr:transposase [Gemmatimonadales bacterium]